jgi:diguanylate cyclase (GGDEF)-like protein
MQELTSVKFEKIQTYLESSGKAILHLIENKASLQQVEEYLLDASLMQDEMFMLHFGSNEDYFGEKFMLVSGEEMRPHARIMNYTERPWYMDAQKVSGNNTIYSLHKDYFVGNFIVNISLNVYDKNGKKAGVVGGSFPVENLDKMLNPGTSGKQNLFLIDSGGFFITHSDTNKILNRNFFEDYGLPEHKNSILKNDKHSRIAGNSRVYFSHIPKMNCFLVTVASLENNSDNIHIKGLTTNFISSILIALFFIILVISGFLILLRIEISSHAETKTVSLTDPLTGIANRRAFLDKIHEEWNRLAREKRQMSFFILDADKFKNYNDDYGHLQGDELLKALANEIKNCARRPGDIAARLGGEEFGILLPEISLENAIGIAENLRQKIEQMRVPMLDGSEPVVVTVSIGVASAIPSSENSYETLIKIADKMLYKAKQSGRNMVCGS